MLVGNKCDEIGARELTVEEGKERARLWSSSFIETSAKANYNVKKLFQVRTLTFTCAIYHSFVQKMTCWSAV